MSLGETAAALAKDAIQKYGTTIVLKHRTSVYDPDTGVNTVSEASVTTKAAIDKVDYNLMVSLGKNNNLGITKMIVAGDEVVAVGDIVTLSGANYAIISATPVMAMDEVAVTELVGERQ